MSDLKLVSNKNKDEFETKVRRHHISVMLRTLVILAALFGIGAAVYYHFVNVEYTEYTILSKSMRTDADTARYMSYNGNVLKYSQDGAEAFDSDNNALWNMTYEMSDPKVVYCQNFVALGDLGSTSIYVMDTQGTQSMIQTKLPVTDFAVAAQGVVAAVLDDSRAVRIVLYTREGNQLATVKCTMSQSGYPISVSLSPNGTLLGVSYVRVENGQLCSSVAFYNFGGVGQNEIENYVSGYNYPDTIFPVLKFLNDSRAVAVGSDRLVFYSGNEKPESLSENAVNEEIQGLYFGDNKTALVYRSGNSINGYRVDIYDVTGKMLHSQEFNMAYTDIQLGNDLIIIYNDRDCLIYNLKGDRKFAGRFEDAALLMAPTSSRSRYILVNRDTVETIRLR